jgi:hypothetical protein
MRYLKICTLLFLIISFRNSSYGQNNINTADIAVKDSITRLLQDFGKSFDLFVDPTAVNIGGLQIAENNRENAEGYNLFISLFDTINFKNNLINFIDPAYLKTLPDLQNCPEKNNTCIKDLVSSIIVKNPDYKKYLSINEYVKKYRNIFLTEGEPTSMLPGCYSALDVENMYWTQKISRSFGRRYKTLVEVPYQFSGVYLTKENNDKRQETFNLADKFIVQVSFDKVKGKDFDSYTNFKIDRVIDKYLADTTVITNKYIFSISPFIGGGLQNPYYGFSSSIENAFNEGENMDIHAGIIFERRFMPFNKRNLNLTAGTGVLLKNQILKNSLNHGYTETIQMNKGELPFPASENLTEYILKADVISADFNDSQWFVGIPLKVGLGFNLNKSSLIRGFFNSSFTYFMPINSKSEVNGEVNYTSILNYNFNGAPVQVTMNGNSFPEYSSFYGVKEIDSEALLEFDSGIEVKTQAGASIPLSNKSYLNFGPYFTIGSFSFNNNVAFLIDASKSTKNSGIVADVMSPVKNLTKWNYVEYGIEVSMSFDFYKLIKK